MSTRIHRRTLLRGAGVAVALPLLEVMGVDRARAATPGLPRLVSFFVPNGLPLEFFTPASTGSDYALTPLLEPLSGHRDAITVVSGVQGVGGPDSHAAGICAFATGQLCTTLGAAGPSFDMVAAQTAGGDTPFAQLTLSVQNSGQWSSNGYSSACFTNISWSAADTPVPPERDPKLLFARLFGDGTPEAAAEAERRAAYRHSVLDNVQNDLARLQGRLGSEDRQRLAAHLDAVRALEQRIDTTISCEVPPMPSELPTDIWQTGYYRVVDVQLDLLAMALGCGLTRYASFMLADGAGNGAPDTEQSLAGQQHELAHAADREAMRAFSAVHVAAFARLLDKLAAASEGDGSVLDDALVVMGTELGDGTAHTAEDLPFVLAGGAGGAIETGRHVALGGAPIAGLQLTLLRRCGIDVASFAGVQTEVAI